MSAKPVTGLRAVKYDHAQQNLLLILIGFALSVIGTRLFLELTGYPRIASGDFHIAHVLWGGLLLYVAALLVLIWRGQEIHWLSSLLTGVGFGLFIDEIGKFITRTNDYFYPLAAPLIYAFFLLSVLVYIWIRNLRVDEGTSQVYRVLDILEQSIYRNLSLQQKELMKQRLSQIAQESDHPNAALLAGHSLHYLEEVGAFPHPVHPPWTERLRDWLHSLEEHFFDQARLRTILIVGSLLLALRGLLVVFAVILITVEVWDPASWRLLVSMDWMDGNPVSTPRLVLFVGVMVFEALNGLLLLTVGILLLKHRIRWGIALGYWVLLFSLTALRLPVLYFEQFSDIAVTLFQFALLIGMSRYRSQYPGPKV
jgi:hypothetical protein